MHGMSIRAAFGEKLDKPIVAGCSSGTKTL